MKIHKETIASELQLLIDGVNTKEQAVEEIAAYIRWRDKQLTIPAVAGRSELLPCDYCEEHRPLKYCQECWEKLEQFKQCY